LKPVRFLEAMSTSPTCPQCGSKLPEAAFEGLCPRCLADWALNPDADLREPPASGPQPESTSEPPGSRRFGDYDLLEEAARGGMGVVYRARQRSLNRIVALKMILAGQLASKEQVERFRAEAQAAAHLQHPNIVAIHEVGEADGQHYFSMDYVEGRNLAELVRERPLPARQAAQYVKSLAEAVHYAHRHGIIHRDLKPSNVLIDANDQPRITDFGLAKRLENSEPGTRNPELTLSGTVLGSPNYLPPEQAGGKRGAVGPASDVYSLGAILYHLLTGRPPFQAESLTTLIRQVLETEPVAPRLLNPSIPRDLETICLKCLEKEIPRRYATAQELADDLSRFLEQKPIRARRVRGWERALKWARRKPLVAGLAAAVVGVTALGFVGVMWQWRAALDARRAALRAEQDAREKLAVSYLAQARANRWSGRPGRRFDSLEALAKAAEIRASLHEDKPTTLELRNEAIACLALADVKVERWYQFEASFDAKLERYARSHPDGSIGLYHARDDQELFRLPAPGKPDRAAVNFSPDGQFLSQKFAAGGTEEYRVWNLSRREVTLAVPLNGACAAFTPDSRFLAIGEQSGMVRFYDLSLGVETKRIPVPERISGMSFDPMGRWLAMASKQSRAVFILDVEAQEIAQKLDHPTGITWPDWSRDGSLLACPGDDRRIYLWNVARWRQTAVLEGHQSVVTGVAFNQMGDMLISEGWDGTTRFWHPALGRLLFSISGSYLPIAFASDDRRLRFALNSEATGIWSVEPARECRRLSLSGNLWDAHFSPDQRLLATAHDDGVRLWDVAGQQLLTDLPASQSRSVRFAPDGRSLIVGGWNGLSRWPVAFAENQSEVHVGPEELLQRAPLESVVFNADGSAVLAAARGAADLVWYELRPPGWPQLLRGHPQAMSVDVSPDGKWFATGTWQGSGVKVWEMQSLKPVKELPVSGSAKCRFSPDGRWLVTGSAKEYRFWQVPSWEPGLGISRERIGDMWGEMAFSPDGRVLALLHGRNMGIKLVSVSNSHEPGRAELLLGPNIRAAQQRRPTGSTRPMRDPESIEAIQTLATLEAGGPLCFSPDGGWLTTVEESRQALLVWDLRLIRRHLASMGLDWDAPPLAPAVEDAKPVRLTAKVLTDRAATTSWRTDIPPRARQAGPNLIDLSRHYNASLKQSWHDSRSRYRGNNLATLPTGLRTLGGVSFDVRGLIQVGNQPGISYPRRVTGIAVERACERLHFLHAAVRAGVGDGVKEGALIGCYVVHYASGEQTEVPLVVGENLANWWEDSASAGKPYVVAWRGTNAFGARIRLFKSTWENPRPADVVQSIDLVSQQDECAPFLVALTAEP
jgi:eukaryotic-like serine/threonine-protein kinase